ncbi:hypothetical protein BKA64DRAFT_671355 [Cadophora sp. MPI-SDFR-AT-0126]|nr:hypothetical protein BKA64DRAFT_671355 [Leotiomycetes sp. MPI-SDFR-AT-0126]
MVWPRILKEEMIRASSRRRGEVGGGINNLSSLEALQSFFNSISPSSHFICNIQPSAKMSIFRPDNPKRQDRAKSLQTEANTFYIQSKSLTDACETHASNLFESTKTIAQLQKKEITEFFPEGATYHNAVFEGGFQYYPPNSGDSKMPKLLYYTLTAALSIGSATAYYRAGSVLAVMAEGIAGAARMRVWRILRMGMAAGGEAGFGAAGRFATRLSRFGTFFLGLDIGLQILNIGLDLYSDEKAHTALVKAIHDLAPLRLNACAHMLMARRLQESMIQHAAEAGVYAKNAGIATQYDIKENLSVISAEITKIWDQVSADALKQVTDMDKNVDAYTTDDPTLTADSTDFAPRTAPKMIKLELGSETVVNWIRGFNDQGDGIKFGNDGGNKTTITLDADEKIQSATWKTGMSEDGQNKVIFGLTVKTDTKSYGPFGSGDKIKADATQQSFTVPGKMRVVGVTDLSADVVQEGEDAVLKSKPFVAELRFVITADK